MTRSDITLIINTCDKFSDLWDAHILLLEENWGDRNIPTIILTDSPTERSYEGITIACAGAGAEITERLHYLVPKIETRYVLMTLDDYFLTTPIDSARVEQRVEVMEREDLDYLRLFNHPRLMAPLPGYKDVYEVNLNENYAVNLYPGIWKTEFLLKALKEGLNAWQFEVSLTVTARENSARCAGTVGDEFPFLDVVRKGKLLHKAARYFRDNPIYSGNREVIGYPTEIKIAIRTWLKESLPKPILRAMKSTMVKLGAKYYSEGI